MRVPATILALTVLVTGTAQADPVAVEITGQVIFNAISGAPLDGVGPGETAVLTFLVDSNNFVEGVPDDTRGYEIEAASFQLSFSGGVTIGLIDPFPAGQTPFFTLVDGFPVSDGFFVSTSSVSPGGVPLSQDPVNCNFDVGYVGETLSSLDILDALGTYDFDGLTRFGFNLWSIFPDNVGMEMDFSQMTIEAGPVPVLESSWGEVKNSFK